LRSLASRICLINLLLFGLAFPATAQDSLLTFFPSGRLIASFRADALAHQLSISRVTDNRDWIGVIGASIPLLQLNAGVAIQAGVGASVFNRIVKTPGHITVNTVDYKVDFPIDVRFESLTIRIGYGHISSHYADDGIEQLGKQSISSVKDYAQTGAVLKMPEILGRLYGLAIYNYHNEPALDKRWALQIGVEGGEVPVTSFLTLYAAVDVKVKEEVGWGSTQSYQVGAVLFERERLGLRLAFTHRRGFEERGQVYNETVNANLVSLFIDF